MSYLAEPAVQGGIVLVLTQTPKHQDYNTLTIDLVQVELCLLTAASLLSVFLFFLATFPTNGSNSIKKWREMSP